MKRILYTIGMLLGTASLSNAQTVLLTSNEEIAEVTLVGKELVVFTKKEKDGQFLYTTQQGSATAAQKPLVLNLGQVNALIGDNPANNEVYVYHKTGRRTESIGVYTLQEGVFQKTGERPVPRMRNHSQNMGMYLTEDLSKLYISAELGSTQGYDDLYLSEWDGKAWSKPRSLGKNVNSRDAEFAPFVAGDSLFFARKEGMSAYIYTAPLNGGQNEAAVRLASVTNSMESYNAYFRKTEGQTIWVSASSDEQPTYTAYLLGNAPEPEAAPETQDQIAVSAPEAVAETKPVRAASPSLVLYNGFNRVHLSLEELAGLSRFLQKQPAGTTLVVKGYSDGYGEPDAKSRVSEQRAHSVKHYIGRYFSDKGFKVEIESEVLPEKGKAHRKTELYLMQ
ncbi:hypothetical protein H9Q13_16995 [Pontibacter sp. JH31]|uniref:OmpA-like domain-containing protein n=1 Tax=Pontibacter aquaedesilientis TaxID=2766980 RepID=A0ABR7XKQ2_9BACT|nr:hypothetical protein [Pontibacter aquaedesilientis]MBD1398869.1 hypothetical protein [Pontibacter aquaedesilientis]